MPLRGSVTQQTPSVRMRARETSRAGILLRLMALAASIALIIGIPFWLWHIGWVQKQGEHLTDAGLHATQKAQFAVKDIVVQGRQQVSRDSLSSALGTIAGAPIFSFDVDAAQARVAKLPWVSAVTIERRLPDTILVRLKEHTPLARWQRDGKIIVIDTEGSELPEAKLEQFSQLPLVVGSDAAGQAKGLMDMLKNYPQIINKMTAAVRVGERRWDLHLTPKVVARLPEMGAERALDQLSDLITDQKILERDIIAIDLRNLPKIVVEPRSTTPVNTEGTRL
ncbi:MAG: FtsQ-type POTRA domain-containing protein [Alphaproteobacteria bacterium]